MDDPSPVGEEALAVLESYQRQLEALTRQIQLLQNVLDDVVRARTTLEALDEEKDPSVLIPVGASTFLRGTLEDAGTVLTGIGAGYATEKPRAEAIRRLSERESQVREETERLMKAAVELQHEAAQLQDDLGASDPASGEPQA